MGGLIGPYKLEHNNCPSRPMAVTVLAVGGRSVPTDEYCRPDSYRSQDSIQQYAPHSSQIPAVLAEGNSIKFRVMPWVTRLLCATRFPLITGGETRGSLEINETLRRLADYIACSQRRSGIIASPQTLEVIIERTGLFQTSRGVGDVARLRGTVGSSMSAPICKTSVPRVANLILPSCRGRGQSGAARRKVMPVMGLANPPKSAL